MTKYETLEETIIFQEGHNLRVFQLDQHVLKAFDDSSISSNPRHQVRH